MVSMLTFVFYTVFIVSLHFNKIHTGENEFHRKRFVLLLRRLPMIPFLILVDMDNQTLCNHGLITLGNAHTGKIFSHFHYHVSRSDQQFSPPCSRLRVLEQVSLPLRSALCRHSQNQSTCLDCCRDISIELERVVSTLYGSEICWQRRSVADHWCK